jgi:hypothetical protein
MKKPFKDTKLGQFLSKTAPKVLGVVADVLPDKGLLGIVKNLIDNEPDMIAEQKAEALKLMQEFELELEKIELSDRNSARDLQKTALTQDDKFSKHYLYYLSSFVIVSSTAFGMMLFFVDFPESNRRLVEMFADIYLFAGAVMVLQFFFGSSQSSHDKSKQLFK